MDPKQRASITATFAKAQNQQKGQASFLGLRAPFEVEQLAITLTSSPLEKEAFRLVIAFVFEYMKGNEVDESHWQKLKESTNIDEIILSTVFSGTLCIFRIATRNRTALEVFTNDCLEVLKIPKEFVVEMGLAIQNWYVLKIK